MALVAHHTRSIKIGTRVSILGNRIAPVTAHSIATINELVPGRVILGVGTGFNGHTVMGMPPITLKTMREHIEIIRDHPAGKAAVSRKGSRERHVWATLPGNAACPPGVQARRRTRLPAARTHQGRHPHRLRT